MNETPSLTISEPAPADSEQKRVKSPGARLFASICELQTLNLAWEQIKKKGSAGGLDDVSIKDFGRQSHKNLARLRQELLEGRYVPTPARRIHQPKDSGGHRPIGLPTVRDKIVQKAVAQVIEPLFNRHFLDCSYAYRRGKGHRKAIRRVEHHVAQGLVWVSSSDIDEFFDTVDHGILNRQIEERIWEPEVLRVIRLFLKIGVMGSKGYGSTELGVGQGSAISPLLSNIYLTPFDRALQQKGYVHVRYADNYLILCRTQEQARQAHREAGRFLEESLKLRLNPLDGAVRNLEEGFIFLGVLFRGSLRMIAPEKLEKAKDKLRRLAARSDLRLDELIEDINESVAGWRYYYGELEVREAFQQLDEILRDVLTEATARALRTRSSSRDQASQVLAKVRFLLDENEERRNRLVAQILSQAAKEQSASVESPSPRSDSSRPLPGERDAGLEKSVRAAVARKKLKHQLAYLLDQELILDQPATFLGRKSERLVVKQGPKILKEVPPFRLKNVMIAGRGIALSSDALDLCLRHEVAVSLLDFTGKPMGRLVGPVSESAECGVAQLKVLLDGRWLSLSKCFVRGKIRNQWNLIKYLSKYHKDENPEFARAFETESLRVEGYLDQLRHIYLDPSDPGKTRNQLFAIEGQAAAAYWGLIKKLVGPEVDFAGRQRQGATDLVNSMLNYGYGVLYNRVWAAVLLAGLNPAVGFLHANEKKRPALIFDLIEEFRPQAVDRVVVTMLNRKEMLRLENGLLSRQTRNRLLENVLERLHSPTRYRSRFVPLAEVVRLQAQGLAQFLLHGRRYRPFVAKW